MLNLKVVKLTEHLYFTIVVPYNIQLRKTRHNCVVLSLLCSGVIMCIKFALISVSVSVWCVHPSYLSIFALGTNNSFWCFIFGNYVEWKQYTANGDSHFALNGSCKKNKVYARIQDRATLRPGPPWTSYTAPQFKLYVRLVQRILYPSARSPSWLNQSINNFSSGAWIRDPLICWPGAFSIHNCATIRHRCRPTTFNITIYWQHTLFRYSHV